MTTFWLDRGKGFASARSGSLVLFFGCRFRCALGRGLGGIRLLRTTCRLLSGGPVARRSIRRRRRAFVTADRGMLEGRAGAYETVRSLAEHPQSRQNDDCHKPVTHEARRPAREGRHLGHSLASEALFGDVMARFGDCGRRGEGSQPFRFAGRRRRRYARKFLAGIPRRYQGSPETGDYVLHSSTHCRGEAPRFKVWRWASSQFQPTVRSGASCPRRKFGSD